MENFPRTWIDLIAPYQNHPERRPAPENVALLIVDMQNYFVRSGMGRAVVPVLNELIKTFHDRELPVFFSKHVHKNTDPSTNALLRWWSDFIDDSPDRSKIHESVNVGEGDAVIEKEHYSAFYKTNLEDQLLSKGISDLVIGGVMTNLCCETTARDAFMKNFNVYFLADGCQTATEEFHLATLENIAWGFGTVLLAEDVIGSFSERAEIV